MTTKVNFSELNRINRMGSGSMATVYKVIHPATSRVFALKVIYGNHEDSVRQQICREMDILRDMDHPNIVKCHDVYDNNGDIQVLLEFMDGGSLEGTHIFHEPHLSDLARQILSGLAYLHERHIDHRDIKPSNLLINSAKKVKIADFGVSRVLAQTTDPSSSLVGTLAYMSPERINTDLNHGRYDEYAGDIWSLGVSILEFYLGRFPFAVEKQGHWASLMCAICMSQPPEAPAMASQEFRHFISCCLQREPARRWTGQQLLQHPFILNVNGEPNQGPNENLFLVNYHVNGKLVGNIYPKPKTINTTEDITLDSKNPILLQQQKDKNRDSRERKLEIEEEEHKKKKAKSEEEEKRKEKNKGGVLNNIFSGLVSPKGKEKENEEKAEVKK